MSQPFPGQPPYDPPSQGHPPQGQPVPGQAPYGQPTPFGQPPYGQPAYGQGPYGQPAYGQPVYGQPAYGQAPYGQPPYGHVPHGQLRPAAPVSGIVNVLGWVIAGLGLLVIVAAFMPWLKVGPVSVSGIGGEDVGGAKDGTITLVLGLVALALAFPRALIKKRSGWHLAAAIVAIVTGSLITLIGIVDASDLPDSTFIEVQIGVGLILTIVGGALLIGAGIAGIVKRT